MPLEISFTEYFQMMKMQEEREREAIEHKEERKLRKALQFKVCWGHLQIQTSAVFY